MKGTEIQEYAQLMRENGLTGLEIHENGRMIRLERGAGCALPEKECVPQAPAIQAVKIEEPVQAPKAGLVEVASPMVGVYYCSPMENAKPFVQIGDTVKKGDVLCIIEAMKLMNEILSEHDGVVEEICVGNNQVVDFGHVLFRIRKEPV